MFLALASLSYYIASRGDSSVTHHGKAAKKSHYASIPLSKACCEELGALQASLAGQARHLNLRASGLHGVHFTLAVFKIENRKEETEETLTHTINKVLKDFLNQRPPVILTFGGVGNFGPHIVHIKIVKTKALEDLHRDMIECLKEEGVYLADDRFSPHVTLFRGRQRGGQGHSKDRSRGSVSASNLTTQELVGKDRSRGSESASNLTTQELVGKDRSRGSVSASNLTTQELVGKDRSRDSESASNLTTQELVGKNRSRDSESASNLTTQELVGKDRSRDSESASNLTTQELVGKERSKESESASNLTTQELVGKDRSRDSVSASNLTTQELVGKERSKESESASNLTTQELVGKNRSRNSVSASNLPLHNLVTRPDLPSVTSSTVTEILFKKLRS